MNEVQGVLLSSVAACAAPRPASTPRKIPHARSSGIGTPRSRSLVIRAPSRDTFDKFQNQEQLGAGVHDVEHGNDAAVPDATREVCLVAQHRDETLLLGEVRMEALEGDGPPKPGVANHASEVDRRHAARRDPIEELVAPDAQQDRLAERLRRVVVVRVKLQRMPCLKTIRN